MLAVAYAAASLTPHTALFHDDGLYLATAESLAAGGGYRIASLPGQPPQTKYPFLYPAVLAALWRWPAVFKPLSTVCTAFWVWAVWKLCRRTGLDAQRAAWVSLAAVAGRWALFIFTAVLPDALFCAISTVALLHLMNIEDRSPPSRWWLWPALAAIECGAAFLTRTVGAALILAGLIALGFCRRFREALLFGALAGTVCLPWIAWQRSQPAPQDLVLAYYSKASYQQGSLLTQPGLERKAAVLGVNAAMLGSSLHVLVNTPFGWVGAALGLALLIPLAIETTARLRAMSAGALWLVISMLVLAGWLGPPFRYVLPVLPIAAIFVALRLREWPQASLALATLVAIASLTTLVGAAKSLHAGRPVSWMPAELDDPAATARLYDWIRRNTPSDAVLAANNDPQVHLETRRPAIRLFASDNFELLYSNHGGGVGTADDLIENLDRHHVRYLLLTPMNGFAEGAAFRRILPQAASRCPGRFALRYQDREPGYAIIEVAPVCEPSSSPQTPPGIPASFSRNVETRPPAHRYRGATASPIQSSSSPYSRPSPAPAPSL